MRASVREKEIAIRGALGAGRRRLVLQMLAESLVLASAGGGLGLLLAYLAIPPIQTLSAGSIPRVDDISIDGRVLAFSLGVRCSPAWCSASRPPGSLAAGHRRGPQGGRALVGRRRAADCCGTA